MFIAIIVVVICVFIGGSLASLIVPLDQNIGLGLDVFGELIAVIVALAALYGTLYAGELLGFKVNEDGGSFGNKLWMPLGIILAAFFGISTRQLLV